MKSSVFAVAIAMSVTTQASGQSPDPWRALAFLEGRWEARTGIGAAAKVAGTYVFQRELQGHVLARHSTTAGCAAPQDFDCEHGDLLYVYQDPTEPGLSAIYFDNEGHVIRYAVSTPDATTAVFLSSPGPGPRFRLVYHLEGTLMSGKFQSRMPAQSDWTSYLEWSGSRR